MIKINEAPNNNNSSIIDELAERVFQITKEKHGPELQALGIHKVQITNDQNVPDFISPKETCNLFQPAIGRRRFYSSQASKKLVF